MRFNFIWWTLVSEYKYYCLYLLFTNFLIWKQGSLQTHRSINIFINTHETWNIKKEKWPPPFILWGHLINFCIICTHVACQLKPWNRSKLAAGLHLLISNPELNSIYTGKGKLLQNGCHFTDISFKCIFCKIQNSCILIQISLKFVPKGPDNYKPAASIGSDNDFTPNRLQAVIHAVTA